MYDHFIAIDWAQANMALTRVSKISEKIITHEGPADILEIQIY